MTDETPALWELAGIYLNADWRDDYADEWAALDAFVREIPEDVPLLPAEIDLILRRHRSEDALGEYLKEQGAVFVPDPERGGYRAWLTEVARRVRPVAES